MGWFADPLFLLLLPVPLVLLRLRPGNVPARSEAVMRVPGSVLSAAGLDAGGASLPLAAATRHLPGAVWIALVLALAGPQSLTQVQALPVSSKDILLTLDLSGSMEREDFALNGEQARRLDVVKTVAAPFVRSRAGDRVGLVIFAEHAFVAAPLSHDVSAVAETIETSTIGIAGRSTAISDGLGLALRRLERSEARGRTIILLSDGISNAGSVKPRAAAALANELGIRIHTIAFGPRDFSDGGDLRDVVDAATLKDIAELSGGTAFRARTTEDLQDVSDTIAALEGTPSVGTPQRLYRSHWLWPALVALALLALSALPWSRAR